MKTEDLIQHLGNDLVPIRPLAPPWKRAVVWLACAGLYLGASALLTRMGGGSLRVADWLYVVQQLALLATAAAAALAAFSSVVPGGHRRMLGAPWLPGFVAI